jgi:hypothetical protein
MSGRDMLKSYSQAALRTRLLNDSETRLNNTSDLTRISLPGLRTADKTLNVSVIKIERYINGDRAMIKRVVISSRSSRLNRPSLRSVNPS